MKRKCKILPQKNADDCLVCFELSFGMMKKDKIVNIPYVTLRSQFVFDKLVKLIQVNVGKKLRSEIAKGHAFAFFFCLVVCKNCFDKPNDSGIRYSFPDY